MVRPHAVLAVALLVLPSCERPQQPPAPAPDPRPAPRPPLPKLPRAGLPVLDRSALIAPDGWTLYIDEPHGLALAYPPALKPSTSPGALPLVLEDGDRGAGLLVARGGDALPAGVPFGGGQQDLSRVIEFLRGTPSLKAAPGALEYYGLSGDFSLEKVGSPKVGPLTGEELRLRRELPCVEKGGAECEQLLTNHARLVLVEAGLVVWQLWAYSDEAAVADRRGAVLSSLLATVRFFQVAEAVEGR